MKKILILEDNPTTLKNLTQIVQNVDAKNVAYSFRDLKDAYQCAMDKVIDLFMVNWKIKFQSIHPKTGT